MTVEVVLTSVEDGATLTLTRSDASPGEPASFEVTGRGAGYSVSVPVDGYLAPSLPDFFGELERPPKAGRTEVSWESLEGEFKIISTLDALGHVYLRYELRSPDIGSNKWWSFTGRIVLELGAMPSYGQRIKAFWGGAT